MKFLLQFLLALTVCTGAYAQTNYNSIATAYVTTTISQDVVFNSAMQAGGIFTFSVLAHNGGGRAGQSDTANVRIQFYTAGGALVTSVNTNHSANLPNPNAVCGNPCVDPSVPWTTLSISSTLSAAQAGTVAYARVSMYGVDGSFWAGDYGPWYRAPTFQLNGGGNLTYNPEFGPAYGYQAQGWTTNPGMGACQGAWGGSNPCIVNSSGTPGTSTPGLVANENGGGPSTTGGTTSGTAGGYNSTMSVTNAGPDTGTEQTAPAPAAPALCCGGSAAQFNASPANTASLLTFTSRTTANSQVYIEQIGTQNTVEVTQSGTRNNYTKYVGNGLSNNITIDQKAQNNSQTNYVDLAVSGNFNTVDIKQRTSNETNSFGKGAFVNISGNNNSLLLDQKNSGSHYAEVNLSGDNKNVDITQQGSAGHMAKITLSGTPTDLSLTQSGSTQNHYSITHNCTTAGGCSKITVTQGQ